MRYGIRIIAALGLVALLVPVAAVAKDARVKGPSALVGAGYFGGELELAIEDGQRPVKIAARAGYIGVLDLGGDLKIRCIGKGRVQKQETEQGMVYRCAGRRAARCSCSAATSRSAALRRTTRRCCPPARAAPATGASSCAVRDGAGEERRKAPERTPKPARESDEIPSLDELAGMLDG